VKRSQASLGAQREGNPSNGNDDDDDADSETEPPPLHGSGGFAFLGLARARHERHGRERQGYEHVQHQGWRIPMTTKDDGKRQERVAVIGYDEEGRSHAKSLKASGHDVVVAMLPGGMSWVNAIIQGILTAVAVAAKA